MTVAEAPDPHTDDEIAEGEARRRRAVFGLVGGFLAILVIIAGVQWATDSDDDDTGRALPDATLITLDGEEFVLTSTIGEPTVVNFFASWCAPCRAELPEFEEVSQTVAGEVTFVGINTRETDVDAARELIDQTGVSYTIALGDDGVVYEAVGGLAMPTTAFVDADGVIVEVHSGILDAGSLESKIAEHFG